jgi:uracil DNA glycosylase
MINTEKIIEELKKRLQPSGWSDALWMWWISPEFKSIIEALDEDRVFNGKFVPAAKDMFSWLYECPYDSVSVLMLVDTDNKNLFNNNTGIPLYDKSNNMSKLQKQLLGSLPEKRETLNVGSWCNQGVLIMPMSCTTRMYGTPHYKIWKPFVAYMLNKMNTAKSEIPCIHIGTRTTSVIELLETDKKIYVSTYPELNTRDCWNRTNEWIKENNQTPIIW